jgi:hypothetical protein
MKYIDDGVIDSGTYVGYHRVFGLQISGEMSPSVSYYAFITQDYKKFYFDTDIKYPNGQPDFDTTRVVGNVSMYHLISR